MGIQFNLSFGTSRLWTGYGRGTDYIIYIHVTLDFSIIWTSVTGISDYFGPQWLLQWFQTILVFTDSITKISNFFCLQWLFYRDFKLILSSLTLLKWFQAIFVFSDSITGLSDSSCLQKTGTLRLVLIVFGYSKLFFSSLNT